MEQGAGPNESYALKGLRPLAELTGDGWWQQNITQRTINLLLRYGTNPNFVDDDGDSILYHLACLSWPDQVGLDCLLDKNLSRDIGAYVYAIIHEGESALYLVAYSLNIQLVGLLLERGAGGPVKIDAHSLQHYFAGEKLGDKHLKQLCNMILL